MIHKGLYDYRDLFHNHTAFRDSKAVIGLQVADICANICYRFHRSDRKDLGAYTLLWRRIMCEGARRKSMSSRLTKEVCIKEICPNWLEYWT